MRHLLFLASFLFFTPLLANMASPIFSEGTLGAQPFISEYVDIVNETIHIVPDSQFQTAAYDIVYTVDAKQEGTQIPMLFYALEFKDYFHIWVDDSIVELRPIPEQFIDPFEGYDHVFGEEAELATVQWPDGQGLNAPLHTLKYFEMDLSQGRHTIRVTYDADVRGDSWGWVNRYSFRYSLSPAQYWKSFGELTITVDNRLHGQQLTTDLEPPHQGSLDSVAVWHFSYLPADMITIEYEPELTSLATTLIDISPDGMAGIVLLLLACLHLFFLIRFRKKFPAKRFSWVVIVGGLIVPFLALLAYVKAYDLINWAIGPEASPHNGGYSFLIFILYPIVMPIYLGIMWGIDYLMKRQIKR